MRLRWLKQFVLPGSEEEQLLDGLKGKTAVAFDDESVSMQDGRRFVGPQATLVKAVCDEERRDEAASLLLRTCRDRLATAQDSLPFVRLVRGLVRSTSFESEWLGLRVVLVALTPMPWRDISSILQLQRMLLDDPERCSFLHILVDRFGYDVLELTSIPVEEENCSVVLERLWNAGNWLENPNPKWRWAVHKAAYTIESSHLFHKLRELDSWHDDVIARLRWRSHLPGNGAALTMHSHDELLDFDLKQWLDEQKFVSLCYLFSLDHAFANAAMRDILSAEVKNVHAVVVLALIQLRPEFEATLRARAAEVAPKLLSARPPKLAAWLLDHLDCNVGEAKILPTHFAALFAWNLVPKSAGSEQLLTGSSLLWRPYMHKYFSADKRHFVVFLLCLLKRVFPRADRYVREMLITRVMTLQWFDHKWSPVPLVDLGTPWKVLGRRAKPEPKAQPEPKNEPAPEQSASVLQNVIDWFNFA